MRKTPREVQKTDVEEDPEDEMWKGPREVQKMDVKEDPEDEM
jgi:hypothetical protein